MRVTHQDDHVTHAVLSGNQTQNMGISDSAEFFHILSSSLYQNQRLAVIREVICNAWDAHIFSGREQQPIRVMLEDDTLIIQDFGPGISPEDFGPIYGVYGHSTKKGDGKQTGGFGLGCKSPFAYTDHFEVTSCHKGLKTVYALSKSSAEAQGKPGITPIVTLPCDEHGVTVKIKLKNVFEDRRVFNEYIRQVVRNGEIFATLNGVVLPIYPFTKSENNFITLAKQPVEDYSRIYLRYGNVIYPVHAHADYQYQWGLISHAMSENRRYLVLLAPPHSISVTPSRESLSMQDKTIKTLTGLLDDFNKFWLGQDDRENKLIPVVIEEMIKEGRAKELLIAKRQTRNLFNFEAPDVTLTTDQLVRLTSKNRNDRVSAKEFFQDYRNRARTVLDIDPTRRERILELLKIANKKKFTKGTFGREFIDFHGLNTDTHWIQRKLLRNVIRAIQADKNLHLDRLRVHSFREYGHESEKILDLPAVEVRQCIRFYDAPIVLATNLKTITNAYNIEQREFISYVCGNQKVQIDAAREMLANSGFKIIDLIVEKVKPVKDDKPKEKVKKLPGIPKLSNALIDDRFNPAAYMNRVSRKVDMERIEDPKYVVQINKSDSNTAKAIDGFLDGHELIIEMFGDECGVCTNSRQLESYIKKGAIQIRDVFLNFMMKELSYQSNIRRYFEINPPAGRLDYEQNEMLQAALGFRSIRALFGVEVELTDLEKKMVKILNNNRSYLNRMEMYDLDQEINSIAAHPMYLFFTQKLSGSGLMGLIDSHQIRSAANSQKSDLSYQLTENILLQILNE